MVATQATIGSQRFVDKRETQGEAGSPLGNSGANASLYVSRASMKAALQDGTYGNASYYTDAKCAKLTFNDMQYAVRKLYDSAGI